MPEKLKRFEEKLISTKEHLENAKEELQKPFEKADELKNKVLRLAELNKLLDMGEVEEKRNDNPLEEDVKRAIIDFCNREYEENHSYDEFNTSSIRAATAATAGEAMDVPVNLSYLFPKTVLMTRLNLCLFLNL